MNDSSFHLEKDSLRILAEALEKLDVGFASLPSVSESRANRQQIENVLNEVAERLHDNFPYFHPLYAGQMLKPPHPVSRLAQSVALMRVSARDATIAVPEAAIVTWVGNFKNARRRIRI